MNQSTRQRGGGRLKQLSDKHPKTFAAIRYACWLGSFILFYKTVLEFLFSKGESNMALCYIVYTIGSPVIVISVAGYFIITMKPRNKDGSDCNCFLIETCARMLAALPYCVALAFLMFIGVYHTPKVAKIAGLLLATSVSVAITTFVATIQQLKPELLCGCNPEYSKRFVKESLTIGSTGKTKAPKKADEEAATPPTQLRANHTE